MHRPTKPHERRGSSIGGPRGSPDQRGFTLVELLVVLAILGLLVAVATPQVLKYLARARVETAKIEMRSIATALDLYLVDVGRYPSQQEGLQALVANPGGLASWQGPYLKSGASGVPLDPWRHPYQYSIPGQSGDYDLFSMGPDNNSPVSAVAGAAGTSAANQ
jgi:general secretion pathway protein G